MQISKKNFSVPVGVSNSIGRPPSLRAFFFTVLLILFTVLFTQQVQAHKLNVFCWTGDQQIYGETFFSGGRKAKNVPVHVQDAKSLALLFTTKTDQKGKFQFAPPQQAVTQKSDLLISVNTGDGHRGEWLLTADEYLPMVSETSETSDPAHKKQPATMEMDMESMRAMIRQEVDRELLPVKRKLAESKGQKPRLQDILGGIGCIIGLAGLLAWFQAKKKNTSING